MKKILMTVAAAALMLTACMKEATVTVTVENKADLARTELAEVTWSLVKQNLKLEAGQKFVVLDEQGRQVPYQLVTYGQNDPQLLVFPVSIEAGAKQTFTVKAGEPDSIAPQVQVNFVPQRKDDISWENDRVAFRMYGPALEIDSVEPLTSCGIDLWVKKTPNLVTMKWYADDLAGIRKYHDDHGEGLDFYSVGTTLGCGAAAPYANDSLYRPTHNFSQYEILDNGPLRVVFKLTYPQYYVADSVLVNETRTVSLDAGSNLNKITENYGDISKPIQVAAGFPYYDNEAYVMNAEEGYIAYAQPENPENGTIYVGLVADVPLISTFAAHKQLLGLLDYQPSWSAGRGLTYYSGGGWSKGGYPTAESWNSYVADFAKLVRNPLIIGVQ